MRRFTIQLLVALDFAYEHNLIHTGIYFSLPLCWNLVITSNHNLEDPQPSNIFVKVRDHSRIESGYLAEVPISQQNRFEEQYKPVPSHPLRNYYFNLTDRIDVFDIALGDCGVSSWADRHLTDLIQPVAFALPRFSSEPRVMLPWKCGTLALSPSKCFPHGETISSKSTWRGLSITLARFPSPY